jgi:hypothetical protein
MEPHGMRDIKGYEELQPRRTMQPAPVRLCSLSMRLIKTSYVTAL